MIDATDIAGSPVSADFHEDSCPKQGNLTAMTEQSARENVSQQCSLSDVIHDGAAPYALNSIPNEKVRDECSQDLVENSVCNNIQDLRDATGSGPLLDQTIPMENKMLADENGQVNSLSTNANDDLSVHEDDLLATVMKILEARHLKTSRPLPVFVRGMEVDLLRLSIQVKGCGGYDKTTKWSSISDGLGFGQECGPLLKLVYVKYLKLLENWKLVTSNGTKESTGMSVSKGEGNGEIMHTIDTITASNVAVASKRKTGEERPTSEKTHIEQQPVATSESLVQMLEWLKQLALNPGDRKKVVGSRASKWNEARMAKWGEMVLKLRAALLIEEKNLTNEQPLEIPVSHPKKRSRWKHGVGKGSAKKARHT